MSRCGAILFAVLMTSCGGGTSANDAAPPPAHVLTAEYSGSNGGYGGPVATMGAYASWAIGGTPTQVHSAAMKLYAYTDPNRAYRSDNDYRITNLLDEHQGAIAKDCAGKPITTAHGNGLLTDVRLSEAIGHATDLVEHVDVAGTDAVFMDDSDNVQYTDNGLPCGYTADSWLARNEAMYDAQTVPLIFNGLSSAEYDVNVLPLADLERDRRNVERLFRLPRRVRDGRRRRERRGRTLGGYRERAAVDGIEGQDLWCFNTARDDGSTDIPLRTYAYASFLLTYDAATSLYQTRMATPSGLRIFPETGLVPAAPAVAAPSAVSSLQTSGGAYGREYGACYYRAAPVGACAVAVNPDNAPHPNPFTAAYTRSIVLRGGGVLDGGALSTNGPVPATLAPHAAAIL